MAYAWNMMEQKWDKVIIMLIIVFAFNDIFSIYLVIFAGVA